MSLWQKTLKINPKKLSFVPKTKIQLISSVLATFSWKIEGEKNKKVTESLKDLKTWKIDSQIHEQNANTVGINIASYSGKISIWKL